MLVALQLTFWTKNHEKFHIFIVHFQCKEFFNVHLQVPGEVLQPLGDSKFDGHYSCSQRGPHITTYLFRSEYI